MANQLYSYLLTHSTLFFAIAIISLIMLTLCFLALPYVVALIPDDYFEQGKRPPYFSQSPHPIRLLLLVAKNIIGLLLVLSGIAMLFLPGQGLLTLLIGMIFLDYPGKYQLERKLLSYPSILKPINWMRRRRNKKEFNLTKNGDQIT